MVTVKEMVMTIQTYNLKASNGKQIRKATRVVLADGRKISFMERMSRRETITNLENQLALAIRFNTPDQELYVSALEQILNESIFPGVCA